MRIQICEQVAGWIAETAPQGTRLPSTRQLARLLSVSRNTVLAAYEELAADGLIEGSHGAGMFVRGRSFVPSEALGTRGNVLRAAHFPQRTAALCDPDGNRLYLNF